MAKAFTTEQKKERIRLAVEVYNQTGAWKDAEKIAHRQNVEKWIRDPEIFAYAESVGYDQLITTPVASFAPKSVHYNCRFGFSAATMHMKEGRFVARDGARLHYAIRDNALVMYKLDGIGNRHYAGPAYFRGTDILANDWTVVD